jgi:hypothetical protein
MIDRVMDLQEIVPVDVKGRCVGLTRNDVVSLPDLLGSILEQEISICRDDVAKSLHSRLVSVRRSCIRRDGSCKLVD